VGLFCAAVAREFGASTFLSVDIIERRVRFAQDFAGSIGKTVIPDPSLSSEENAKRLLETQVLGDGADIVIGTSGA
jgi:D-xylulose reductase